MTFHVNCLELSYAYFMQVCYVDSVEEIREWVPYWTSVSHVMMHQGCSLQDSVSSSCETGKFDTPSSLICIGSGTLYILPLCISLIVNQNTSWIHVSVYELMCANIFTWYSTWLVILGRYLSGNMTTGRFMWRSKMVDLFTCQMSDKIKRDQASSYKLYNFRYTCTSETGVQTYALSSWSEFYKFVRPSVVI